MTKFAVWPDSPHIPPIELPVGNNVNGKVMRFPIRILTEDEYQLLLAGFIKAGGKIEGGSEDNTADRKGDDWTNWD